MGRRKPLSSAVCVFTQKGHWLMVYGNMKELMLRSMNHYHAIKDYYSSLSLQQETQRRNYHIVSFMPDKG